MYLNFTPGLANHLPYKKTLKVKTIDDEEYILYGAFPWQICHDEGIVIIKIDKAVKVS